MADRIEQDSMGKFQVPEEMLYGAQTARAVENFPVSGQPLSDCRTSSRNSTQVVSFLDAIADLNGEFETDCRFDGIRLDLSTSPCSVQSLRDTHTINATDNAISCCEDV